MSKAKLIVRERSIMTVLWDLSKPLATNIISEKQMKGVTK